MPPKATKTTRQSEGLRKHGAESGFDTKDKRDQSTIPGTSKTLSASNKTPCDPKFWQRKTFQQTSPTKAKKCDSEDSEVNELLTSHIDTYNIEASAEEDEENVSTAIFDNNSSSDDEPSPKYLRVDHNSPAVLMNGVTPTMAMPEFTIDKDTRHFITDMGAYLSCFHKQVSDDQNAYLVLSAVKGDAKDILLGYSEEQLNTVVKIFQVLREEFKKREKCVGNLYQIKQEVGEKVIKFAGKIRRCVRALGVNNLRFDNVRIDYLKIGTLPHIQNRLY
jgi:hypothetical protein